MYKCKVTMKSTNILPKCLATPFTVNGVNWEIHNHDLDINDPSCPHMHAIGKPWRLDLYTGCIYDRKSKQIIKKLSKKELELIWNAKGMMKIILAERALYNINYYAIDPIRYPALPPLPVVIKNQHMQKTIKPFKAVCYNQKKSQNCTINSRAHSSTFIWSTRSRKFR